MNLGEKQYAVRVTINPPRAPIYDRFGKYLAINKESMAAFILPNNLESPATLQPFLKKYFPQAVNRLQRSKNSHFMYVARKLSQDQIDLITKRNEPDIKFLAEPSRFYPIASAGPIIGITDIDNHGIAGLEMLFNKQLSGKPITYFLERDARSGHFYFQRQTMIEGKQADSLSLTIDSDLQFLAYEALKKTISEFQAQEGSVIIMNPQTGEIITMVTYPDFDPNNTKNIALSNTKNRIITEEYELGSVIKIFTALAALEEGVVTPDELIDCENVKTTYFEGRKINTVSASVAGIIPFSEVIEKSNNIGIAKVAKRVGPKLYDHYRRVGFGTKTGIEFPGERSGFVNPPQRWSKQSLISLSYGYEITATLLQLAKGFCIIARNGYDLQPTLLMPPKKQSDSKRLYSQETINAVKQILENTVNQGTAKKARIKGYTIMSKTGTANLLVNGEYSPTKNLYTCAGIVEKDGYQRVIVTFVKEASKKNLYASIVAAPLFEHVAEKMLIRDKIL